MKFRLIISLHKLLSKNNPSLTLLCFPVLLLKLVHLQHQVLLLLLNLLLLSLDVLSYLPLFIQPLSADETQPSLPSGRMHLTEQTKTFSTVRWPQIIPK